MESNEGGELLVPAAVAVKFHKVNTLTDIDFSDPWSSLGYYLRGGSCGDGTNWYAYCANNPLAFVDPSGLDYEGADYAEHYKKAQEALDKLDDVTPPPSPEEPNTTPTIAPATDKTSWFDRIWNNVPIPGLVGLQGIDWIANKISGVRPWNEIESGIINGAYFLSTDVVARQGFGEYRLNPITGDFLSPGEQRTTAIGYTVSVMSAGFTTLAQGAAGVTAVASASSQAPAGVNNPVPSDLQFARVIKPSQVADLLAGKDPLLSTYKGAADAFITSSRALPSGLTASKVSELATMPIENVGGIIRFELPSGIGIASPINRQIPGFVGRGLTAGRLPEFVIPNKPINFSNYILELLR